MAESSILALVGRRDHGGHHLAFVPGHARLAEHHRPNVGHQGFNDVGLEAAYSLDVGDASPGFDHHVLSFGQFALGLLVGNRPHVGHLLPPVSLLVIMV